MPKNDIQALRDELFATLRALRDPEKPMDIDRAKAVSEVAREIIQSAKVEVDYLKVTGAAEGTEFIPSAPAAKKQLKLPPQAGTLPFAKKQ